jgi:hypothetical protein
MAGSAAPTAVELREALDRNRERLEAATECLAEAKRVGAWDSLYDCRAAVDLLLDERNALRARL